LGTHDDCSFDCVGVWSSTGDLTSLRSNRSAYRMAISLRDLSVAQLKKAVAIKERMEQLEKELTGILGIPEPMTVGGIVRRRKKMSTAARAKISAAMKARWAKRNGAKK